MSKRRKREPAGKPVNLAAKYEPPPKNFAGYGKYWIDDTLMDISTDKPIMRKVALDSLKEREVK